MSESTIKAAKKWMAENGYDEERTYFVDTPCLAAFADEQTADLRNRLEPILSGGQPYGQLRNQEWEKSDAEYAWKDDTYTPNRTVWMTGFDTCADLIREALKELQEAKDE